MKTKEIFEGKYVVYSDGRVWSNRLNRFLKQTISYDKYFVIGINKKTYKVHRLVAECFVPNPNNLPQVNHKDENKLNNNDWNFEWCNARHNKNHSNKNKFVGSSFNKPMNKFKSTIQHNSKNIHLGYFDTPEEASNVYMSYCITHNL